MLFFFQTREMEKKNFIVFSFPNKENEKGKTKSKIIFPNEENGKWERREKSLFSKLVWWNKAEGSYIYSAQDEGKNWIKIKSNGHNSNPKFSIQELNLNAWSLTDKGLGYMFDFWFSNTLKFKFLGKTQLAGPRGWSFHGWPPIVRPSFLDDWHTMGHASVLILYYSIILTLLRLILISFMLGFDS